MNDTLDKYILPIPDTKKEKALNQYTTEELQEELKKRTWYLTQESQQLVDLIHGMFCFRVHGQSDCCEYYNEAQQDKTWELPAHQEWVAISDELVTRLEITDKKEFTSLYLSVQDVLTKQKALSPKARALLEEISAFNR